MRYLKLVLVTALFFGVFSNCALEEENSQRVRGKLVSEVSGEGIPNTRVDGMVQKSSGSGFFSNTVDLGRAEIVTDANGEFEFNVGYESRKDWVWFVKPDEDQSTAILNLIPRFDMDDLEEGPVLLYVREFHPLEIEIKNTTPFDENDFIGVSVFFTVQQNNNEVNARYFHNVFYAFENRSGVNLPWDPPADDDGLRPEWLGDSIDTTLFGRLQEATEYKVIWNVRKNGVWTENSTDLTPVNTTGLNRVVIEY
ncbi:hypothetical protein [Gilvibacter sp.]|uniref:hypothetical protein n=1 Tax=Gilvibacter sp. TaxID=2729997 RepID=UPI003F4A4A19